MTFWVMCGERKKNFLRNGKEFKSVTCCSLLNNSFKLFVPVLILLFYDGLDKLITNENAAFKKVWP